MSRIGTPAEETASGRVAEIFAADAAHHGRVSNYARLYALRPDVYDAWGSLNRSIRSAMDLRRYELVSVAAAMARGSTYCSLAHTLVLRGMLDDDRALVRVLSASQDAGLEPVDVAVMELAALVASDPQRIDDDRIARMRALGLSESDVLDVVLAAAGRCFFASPLLALGVEPDDDFPHRLGGDIYRAVVARVAQ